MDSKQSGVKVKINNDSSTDDEKTNNSETSKKASPIVRRNKPASTQKSVVTKEPEKTKSVKTKKVKKEKTTSKKKAKGQLMSNFITLLITALIVGGGIYYWQGKSVNEKVGKVEKSARDARAGFEKKIEDLKNKVKGIMTENEDLAKQNEELKVKTEELLAVALKQYENEEIGLSFLYPASFGEVQLEFTNGAKGRRFKGTFSENSDFYFGAVNTEFENSTTTIATTTIIDSQGYYKKSSDYYFQTIGEIESTDYKITPTNLIKSLTGEVVVINKGSFGEDAENFDIEENIAALANSKEEEFKGVTFVNKNFEKLPIESFEQLLKSINY